MANVFDYLAWRGDLPFSVAPFNAVDSLILSRLSYLPFDGVVPAAFTGAMRISDAAAAMHSEGLQYRLAEDERLLDTLAASPRFQNAQLCGFVNLLNPVEEKQFAAVCIHLEGELPYAAFRGTDGTLVGWKEDFNMASSKAVPSQLEAAAYLNEASGTFSGRLRAGGHSKGGNLAVYAAAFCRPSVQARIEAVYNHDGPGFLEETTERPEFARVRDRVHTFVPQSSVVGMLLEHGERTTVVHSTNTFLLQHDLYSWETAANGLVEVQDRTGSSRYIDATIRNWLARMPREDRDRLVDGLYAAFTATGAKTVADLRSPRMAVAVLREVRQMDEPTRAVIREGMALLSGAAKESLQQAVARG